MPTKEKTPLLDSNNKSEKNNDDKSNESKKSKVRIFFGDCSIWLWGIAVGFVPLFINSMYACEVAGDYSWNLIEGYFLGSLDIPFSLMTIYYALYLQSERMPSSSNGFIPVYRAVAIVATIVLLLYATILRYSPILYSLLIEKELLIPVNLVFLSITLFWGILGHIVFVFSR